MSVKTFKYNANVQLTKNFNSNEFQCKGVGHNHETKIDVELVKQLQEFMNLNGYTKAIISSGYRCKEQNKKVGGSDGSQHVKGKAVDICFYEGNKKVLAKNVCCKAQDFEFKGIAYIDAYHVHLDNRTLGKYRGDERNGYSNNVPNGDFYAYFNVPRETYNLERLLKKGDKGEDVGKLQERLNQLGYNCGKIDKIFGKNVEKSVKKFQKANKLTQDGIVGKDTAHALGFTFKGK